ncbi:hypothetical protein GQ472_05125 [archaeon]|nr:hypothetical protein [archaeon]
MKLLTIIISLILVSLVLASPAAATPPEKKNMTFVEGKVFDEDTGLGLSGVEVTALCIESTDERKDPKTDKDGYYKIPTLECSIGNEVIVTVTIDGVEYTNTDYVIDCDGVINMCHSKQHVGIIGIDIAIPEFPIAALPALLSMLSFGLVRKRLF